MNEKDIEQLKDIFVPHKDLIRILDKQAEKTVDLLNPKLDAIEAQLVAGNARFRSIDERCATRGKTCPSINLDAQIALAKKTAEGEAELRKIKREARQEERKDIAQFWTDYGRTVIVGVGIVVVTILTTAVTILVALKGVAP
jgi:hypothetical protein